ncbi:hypothetical protein [Candidatus Hodarchaeum mangrovi]
MPQKDFNSFLKRVKEISHLLSQKRRLFGFITVLVGILLLMVFIIVLTPYLSIPQFLFEEVRITRIDDNSLDLKLNLNFTSVVKQTVKIEKVTCKLTHMVGKNSILLTTGNSLSSFTIKRNTVILENISFSFTLNSLETFLEAIINKSAIEITGRVYFTSFFSIPFRYESCSLGEDFFPSFTLIHLHPLSPGNRLATEMKLNNPHNIDLNILNGSFNLVEESYGFLGSAILPDINLTPGLTQISFILNINQSGLKWMFEQILNDRPFNPKVQKLNLILKVNINTLDLMVEEGPDFKIGLPANIFYVKEISSPIYSLSENIFSFDLTLGLLGDPLWGYNLTTIGNSTWSVVLDFYHYLLDGEIGHVGNGSTNLKTTINYFEETNITVKIVVFPFVAGEMIFVWLRDQQISINIKNGIIGIQMYEIILEVHFNKNL